MGRWTEAASVSHYDNVESNEKERGYLADYAPEPEVHHDEPGPAEQSAPAPAPAQSAPEPQQYNPAPVEPSREWDVHYTPSWFIEEQTNRKNPNYTPDSNWADETVDAIANYVSGKKNSNPNEWKYGDPGWSTDDVLWTDYIQPAEEAYQRSQRQSLLQAGVSRTPSQVESQPKVETKPSYYSFHNNKINTTPDTTALATVQNGTNLAPIRTTDEVAKIKEAAPYKLHQVDTSGANYDTLATSRKIIHNVTPANAGSDVKNQKWYQRYTAPVLGSVMSGSGPASIAKFVATTAGSPIAGLISGVAWAASTGYSYLKGTGTIKGNEKIDKFLELTDILDKKGAQFQGALARGWEKAGGGDLTDWSKFDENMDFFAKNIDTIAHYAFGEGRGSTEYNPEVWGLVSSMTPNIGANVVGLEGQGASRAILSGLSQIFDNPEDKIWLERNQTTRANAGLEGVFEIPEELLGTNAITYWADYAQYLYDNGITNMSQLEYELSTEMAKVYGDLFNTSEFIEHEIGDPGNVAENMQSRVMYGVGKVTGDVNLANAAKAQTGSLIGDLTGNIPIIPDVLRFGAKLVGNNEFLKTSGGIDEVINAWDMENLQSTDPSKLTARDRRLSGINEDGSLKSLDPLKNPNTIKNPFERGAERIKQLFQTTNEWRASMAGDSIMNFISTGIEDAMSARPGDDAQTRIDRVTKFVDELEHPETISADSPFSKPSKTILFNSIKEDLSQAVRLNRPAIDKVITDYAKLEPNRQVLNTLAQALNMTPDKVMSKYENEKTVLAQMIINKADENGGKIPGIDIDVESREFGDRVISMLAPFAGKNAKPYAPQALMTEITSKIGDGVTETLLNKYGIESEGWVYRFGDTVKKLQHLWLLGLSPSYLANNMVNNVLTRSALGYGGFLTPMAINKFTDRFGWKPERFAESMSEGILESKKNDRRASEKMREAIRAKRKGTNKFLDNVDSKLDWVSEHAGLFGAISGKIEELESRQIYTSAMMTYMARTWKPGVNFRKMDPQLENLIRSQNPDMVKAIYDAISSGVSMKEIENAIYGSYVIPSIRETLIEAAQRRGIDGAEDAIIELFDKGGIYAELQQALNGKRGDEIDAVVKSVIERAKAIANIQLAEDIARRAEQVANDTANYGFAEVIQLGQDMADNMADVWIQSQDANSQLFNRRVREGLKTEEFRNLYLEHQKTLNERWAGVYATAQQNYNGILKGLGFTDEMSKKYIDKMIEKDSLWTTFYQKTQPEAFQPYLDALVWRTGDKFETWDSRVKKAWKDYTKDIKRKYNNTLAEEQTRQVEMDQIFADGLKACLSDTNKSKVDSIIVPLQKQIREQRQKIVDKNRELRAIADNTNILNEKNRIYNDAKAERQELVNDYRRLQKQLYDEIRALGPQTVAPAQNSVLAEVDHAANIRADVTERRAEQTKQEATDFTNTMSDRIADKEEMPKVESTTPEGYAKDTKLERLREIAEAEGATEDQADAYANYSYDWYSKLPDSVKKILDENRDLSVKEKYDKANFEITQLLLDDLDSLTKEIETKIGRKPNKKERQKLVALAYRREGMTIPKASDVENDFYYETSLRNNFEKLMDDESAAKFEDILFKHSYRQDALLNFLDVKNKYFLNRQNLENVAIRSGASEKAAKAFSQYISLIADKWEKNHPGQDFFTDAPGIGNLRIDFSKKSDNASGDYSVLTRKIRMYENGDFFTLMHELGHGFQWTLDEQQQRDLAQYFGMEYDEYTRICDEWLNDFENLSPEDASKYSYMTETFARGFVAYLRNDSAPTPAIANIFNSFKKFIETIFPNIADFIRKNLYLNWDWYKENEGRQGDFGESGFVHASEEKNGVALRKIFDSMINPDPEESKTVQPQIEQTNLTPEEVNSAFGSGVPVQLSYIDLSSLTGKQLQKEELQSVAGNLYLEDALDLIHQQENSRGPFSVDKYEAYISELISGQPVLDGEGNPVLSEEDKARLYANLEKYDKDGIARRFVENTKNHLAVNPSSVIPAQGDYVIPTYTFEYGANTIVGAVFHNGELVAYVPQGMQQTRIDLGNGEYVPVLGVSPEHPDQWVYMDGDRVFTEQKRQVKKDNPIAGDAETDSLGALDPGPQANHQLTYEDIVPILQEFGNLYKESLNDAMANKTFGSLDAKTKELVRQYIDNDVRTDLMNTKYKTGKFGEMMRDAALLNYSKRYGFDNAMTLLFPYQFWNTRSAWNWIQRMGGKGGKMWRRYARLKELEERNKKELLPSKVTGKIGIYVPFLPDWMGDALFMPTSQLSIVGNFMDPIDDWITDNKAVVATTERYVQEAFDAGDITREEYMAAMDPAQRSGSAVWQEMFARAQTEGDHDRDLGNLFKQYFGVSLPVSITQALVTGNPDAWTQTPMSRTGTAFRALLGDNIFGKGIELAMSAPERAMRKAAVAVTGNNDFRYQEFGNWGDYYIRNQLWDMVVEGAISPEDAITAQVEKDGNAYWDQAAERQRLELLEKTQLLSTTMPFKKMVEDIKSGNQAKLGDDWKYLLAEILTTWTPTTVVRDAERTWRGQSAELSKLYETNDKEGREKFYDDNPNYTYKNLRYEADPEQALRSYLYKSINNVWYDFSPAEKAEVKMALGPDFERSIISKETRAYQTMDIDRLAAYAQALNGSIPYLATEKLNTMNVPKIDTNFIPEPLMSAYDTYREERDRLYPGMYEVNEIYYSLPADQRKIFADANPDLDKYQKWNSEYKKAHNEVKEFSSLQTDYYNMKEAEEVFGMMDKLTLKALTTAAYSGKEVDKNYQKLIEQYMVRSGSTKKYKDFVKNLTDYILGVQ